MVRGVRADNVGAVWIQIWALRSRVDKQPTDLRRHHHYMRDGTLVHSSAALIFAAAILEGMDGYSTLNAVQACRTQEI